MPSDPLAKLRDRKLNKAMDALPTSRTCAGCDLCCTAVGVEPLAKPPGVRCPHLAGEPGESCTLYPRHPHVCRQFLCAWRASDNAIPERFRPADCGFVVAINSPNAFPATVCVHPDPERPDAWRDGAAHFLFLDLAHRWNCIVAVGQAHLCQRIYLPYGKFTDRTDSPIMFQEDGARIAVPDFLFRPDHRPPIELIADAEARRRRR